MDSGAMSEDLAPDVDYSDLGFPGKPEEGWPTDPYDEDGDCEFCFNGSWKHHAPWCQWADARDAGEIPGLAADGTMEP
jgi:hypothetical protein